MEYGEKKYSSEVKKPPFLYHASPNKKIEEFEPRALGVRDKKEGPVVFGISDKEFATVYLVKMDDSWTRKGKFDGVSYIVISDKKRFEKADKGGALYVLPNGGFEYREGVGIREELINKNPVKPIKKEIYESALEAMLKNAVQVYFVNEGLFKQITNSEDSGKKILSNIESENQKSGINIKVFDKRRIILCLNLLNNLLRKIVSIRFTTEVIFS